ncbi:amidase [Antarcticimicrobium luteum]|uniref:Amidase n=2 Tax=Antarcticimicrobium luteum TaxID=2547397 RepID=A0A4R5V2I8_9RHOB|nr:amidase [Antarcticimicrobium luteum]
MGAGSNNNARLFSGMTPETYSRSDATTLAQMIRSGEAGRDEVHEAAVRAAAAANAKFNFALALKADASEPTREDGALCGVPTLIKDINGHIAGDPVCFGSRLYQCQTSAQSSHVGLGIQRAGMDVIGVSSAPEFSLEGHTSNLLTGDVRNPWATERSPGGSSGGAAAAVASGAVPVAHGSDIAGSIRVPAAWCGCVGLKPSRGRVSSGPAKDEGGFGLATNMFLTRTVRDAAATLDALSRPFPGDPFRIPTPEGSFLASLGNGGVGGSLRIAVSVEGRMGIPVEPETAAALRDVAGLLEQAGHFVEEFGDPLDGIESLVALTEVWLAGFADQSDRVATAQGRKIDETVFGPVALAAYEWSRRIDLAHFLAAIDHLNRSRRQMGEALEAYDIWLSPVTPAAAPRIADLPTPSTDFRDHIERGMAPAFQHTVAQNVLGLPAMSLPLARHSDGRPIGVQLTAQAGREDLLLHLAAFFEETRPWPLIPPEAR